MKLKLLEKFEDTEEIWKLKEVELEGSGVSQKNTLKILNVKFKLSLDKYAKFREKYFCNTSEI